MSLRVMLVAGARPNFIKIAPLHAALSAAGIPATLVHTGQHYDAAMSELFFRQLGIPEPDVNLEVGSASHAVQTAEIMRRFEPVLEDGRPDVVVVVGDVNSTVACGLVAKKTPGVALAHVEAGLRSGDRTMPEEVNRIVTDAISDLLFVSERSGERNLLAEGTPPERIVFAGNVMIDTLLAHMDRARATAAVAAHGLEPGGYAVLTLHRPANVDDPAVFGPLMDAVADVASRLPVLFPTHPRTRGPLGSWAAARGGTPTGVRVVDPLGYLEFLHLMAGARIVLTDSGGIQEETTVLGVPCLTLRDTTERPATVEEGTNRVVGTDPAAVRAAAEQILDGAAPTGRIPEGWDGRAAVRIAAALAAWDGTLR
jgi:UDP-N-acetylglucosamine 2-epimerase (non-hydrolysing)